MTVYPAGKSLRVSGASKMASFSASHMMNISTGDFRDIFSSVPAGDVPISSWEICVSGYLV